MGQLALASLLYPGATHSRFEHSLGVMELAGRVFDSITEPERVTDDIGDSLPQLKDRATLDSYWRRAVQVAALCHDIGHAPFSHAAETLLPGGHEQMTRELILGEELQEVWKELRPPLDPVDVVKLAIGQKKAKDLEFSTWESVLSEVIVGDAFGVDRMDYLLRDSLHMGVSYGRFDHERLIDSLRILPTAPEGGNKESLGEPSLGVEEGGLQSAEALLMARYFMYSQVYFHRVRMVLDLHLVDYLQELQPAGFPTGVPEFLATTDDQLIAQMYQAAADDAATGHKSAARLLRRGYFRVLYEPPPQDRLITKRAGELVFEAAKGQLGENNVKYARQLDEGGEIDFPVLLRNGGIASSLAMSEVLSKLPPIRPEYVFVAPELRDEAAAWLEGQRTRIVEEGRDSGEA
ncbi:MAG: HD domain-containing protein [Actinomycetota bacterium]